MFYLVCRDGKERTNLIQHVRKNQIQIVFHYICLHDSPYYEDKHDGRKMPNAKRYEECLVRLPLWVSITEQQINQVINSIINFYNNEIIDWS